MCDRWLLFRWAATSPSSGVRPPLGAIVTSAPPSTKRGAPSTCGIGPTATSTCCRRCSPLRISTSPIPTCTACRRTRITVHTTGTVSGLYVWGFPFPIYARSLRVRHCTTLRPCMCVYVHVHVYVRVAVCVIRVSEWVVHVVCVFGVVVACLTVLKLPVARFWICFFAVMWR